jgi:hypothetical protein
MIMSDDQYRFALLEHLGHEQPHNLYASPDVIRVTKEVRWAGHVVRMEEMTDAYKILVGILEGKKSLEESVRIILKRILKVGVLRRPKLILRLHKRPEIYLLAEPIVVFRETFCSVVSGD